MKPTESKSVEVEGIKSETIEAKTPAEAKGDDVVQQEGAEDAVTKEEPKLEKPKRTRRAAARTSNFSVGDKPSK